MARLSRSRYRAFLRPRKTGGDGWVVFFAVGIALAVVASVVRLESP